MAPCQEKYCSNNSLLNLLSVDVELTRFYSMVNEELSNVVL